MNTTPITSHGMGRRVALPLLAASVLTVGLAALSPVPVLAAGTPATAGWVTSNNQAGATAAEYGFSLTTATTGVIKTITISVSGTGLGGTPSIALSYGIGVGAVTRTAQVMTYTVETAGVTPAAQPIALRFAGLTNPADGGHRAVITTRTADGATIDAFTTADVAFASGAMGKTIQVMQSLTFTLNTTAASFPADATVSPVAERTYTSTITVLTNAASGYTLAVSQDPSGFVPGAGSAAMIAPVAPDIAGAVVWPDGRANVAGYTVAASGDGDAGLVLATAFAGGTRYAGARATGEIVARNGAPTGPVANTITVTGRVAVDSRTSRATVTNMLSYTLTPNYA